MYSSEINQVTSKLSPAFVTTQFLLIKKRQVFFKKYFSTLESVPKCMDRHFTNDNGTPSNSANS